MEYDGQYPALVGDEHDEVIRDELEAARRRREAASLPTGELAVEIRDVLGQD